MKFTKSNNRISLSLPPGEPLVTDDRLLHQKTLKILSAVNPRTCVHSVCNSPSTANPYGSLLAVVILTFIPSWSCYYKITWKLVVVSIILWAYCLAVLCHLNTPTVNYCNYWVSAHPQLFMSFTKVFKILFDLPKILWSLWLLRFLFARIMVNPISLVVLMTFLVIIILSLLTQYVCEYTQSSLILINYFSGWAAILLTRIGSRPIELSLIVP